MAIRMQILCEICLDDGMEVQARPEYLKVGDVGGLIDLCNEHTESIIKPLQVLITNHSRPEGDPETRPGKRTGATSAARATSTTVARNPDGTRTTWPCPACPGRPAPFTTVSGLDYHAKTVHGVSLARINALITGCRMPECDWTPGVSTGSIASHLMYVHSIPNTATMTAELAATEPQLVEDIMDLWYRSAVVEA
jgi:hypothetical protein